MGSTGQKENLDKFGSFVSFHPEQDPKECPTPGDATSAQMQQHLQLDSVTRGLDC